MLKLETEKFAELGKKIYACFEGEDGVYDWQAVFVDVEDSGDHLTVLVWQMYEYLPMNFRIMQRIAEALGTTDFNVDKWSSGGCETCDYGSRYQHEIQVKKATA